MKPQQYQQTRLVIVGVVIAVMVLFGIATLLYDPVTPVNQLPSPTPTIAPQVQSEDLKQGKGATVKNGDTVVVHYTGKLTDGKQFDSSRGGDPFEFTVGNGEVIRGWDQGLLGMKAGGKRKLTIPPELGYGQTGSPPDIPPNATLVFEIDLVRIK